MFNLPQPAQPNQQPNLDLEIASGDTNASGAPKTFLPVLNLAQVREINRLMVEEYGLGYLQMMEQSGRLLVNLIRRLVGGDLRNKPIVVLAGPGDKGGTGMVTARYLHNAGARVICVASRTIQEVSQPSVHQYRLLNKLAVPVVTQASVPPLRLLSLLRESVLTIDAILGSGLVGYPRGSEAFLLHALKQVQPSVVSLDLPSGLMADTGSTYENTVKAKATLALGLPKTGLMVPNALPYIGQLYLADIGVPSIIYKQVGLNIGPLFSAGEIVLLRRH